MPEACPETSGNAETEYRWTQGRYRRPYDCGQRRKRCGIHWSEILFTGWKPSGIRQGPISGGKADCRIRVTSFLFACDRAEPFDLFLHVFSLTEDPGIRRHPGLPQFGYCAVETR